MNTFHALSILSYVAAVSAAVLPVCINTEFNVTLGSAGNYAVLGWETVTNTGNSVISGGNVGTHGTEIVGFGPGKITAPFTTAISGETANGFADAYIAYLAVAALAPVPLGQQLGASVLAPGVYSFIESALLDGTLTLAANEDPDASWYFQIPSTLTTGSVSEIVLTGGANPCNVWWQVGSSATIGSGSKFFGNILSMASVTLNTGASNTGIIAGINGMVSLGYNAVNACSAANSTSSSSKRSINKRGTICTLE